MKSGAEEMKVRRKQVGGRKKETNQLIQVEDVFHMNPFNKDLIVTDQEVKYLW